MSSEHSDEAESLSSFPGGDDNVNNTTNADKILERKTLASKENRAVFWVRGAVFLVLLGTAALVSTIVCMYTKNDQVQDFESAFEGHATRIQESFYDTIERKLEAVDALSVTITSYAKSTGATFPNVTLPDFEIRCSNSRVLSDTSVINYQPVVTDETRLGWEAYQIANRGHFDEALASGIAQRAQQDVRFGQIDGDGDKRGLQESDLRDVIMNLEPDGTTSVAPEGSGPYLPVWQISPVVPMKSLLNFNVLSHPAGAGSYSEVINTGQAVIDISANLEGENLGNTGAYFKLLLSLSQYRYSVMKFLVDPTSAFGYPVFDSFDHDNRKVVGVISSNLYWRLYFNDILPPNARGIMCVLENSRGQVFTYRIDGSEASYFGNGDLHDSKYDHLEVSSDVSSYLAKISSPETKSYTSVDLNNEYCNYKLRVYPSQDTEDAYVNEDPIIYTVVIASVFLFTSLVIVAYDYLVTRRQRIVMDRAVASSAIVSSLFPSQVRDQLYKENETDHKKKDWKMRDSMGGVGPFSNASDETAVGSSRPIADLFEHTTILFADLVGFTAWSSEREPVQVFELLEVLYCAFDKIAVRRKVFKVETIGDCYVAVTGLPDPQEDHALIMAKFARDCIVKMGQLTTELAGVLGADTATLRIRVGMHSGPVTGGVLRGQKSRFQLFGDSMNTAARMETNGSPGLIHVSQQTADELIAKGKSSWVTPRADKITAKGKGEMQTYWVSPREMASTVISSAISSDIPEMAISKTVNPLASDGNLDVKKDLDHVEEVATKEVEI
jgi:class 3 adenylate cyclase